MELLLNLLWLALALVALGSCWRVSRYSGRSSQSRAFVLTGCLLALMFPVVSASDDLAAMRTEMEERSSSDPSVKKSTASRMQVWGSDSPPFAAAVRVSLIQPERDPREQVPEYCCGSSRQALSVTTGSRAPPYRESFALGALSQAARFSQPGLNAAIPARGVVKMEMQRIHPQTSAVRYGLRSLICEIPLRTASGPRRFPREMAQTMCPRTCALLRQSVLVQDI